MTQEEFGRHEWWLGCKVIYRGSVYVPRGFNYREKLIQLPNEEFPDLSIWVRCENVEIVKGGK